MSRAVLAVDSGTAAIWSSTIAALMAAVALVLQQRNERRHRAEDKRRRRAEERAAADGTLVAQEDVFVKRDEAAWKRMLDALARTDRDVADLRAELATVHADLDTANRRLGEATAHATRCDAELAALRARIDRGGLPT